MNQYRLAILLPLLCLACACTGVPKSAREAPSAWAQSSQEAGKLPVGRIVGKETQKARGRQATPGELAVWGALFGFVGATMAVAISDTSSVEEYYRYAIQLQGSQQIEVREEYVVFNVGDCIALRTEPLMMVPALPGACR